MPNIANINLEQRNNAVHYDITIDKGAIFNLPITFFAPSSSANPVFVPIDLTGFTGLAQIRDGYNNPNVMVQFTITFSGSNPNTGSSDSNGGLTLSLLASQSRPLESGLRGVWDLFMYPSGNVELAERWLEGEAWIRSSTSR